MREQIIHATQGNKLTWNPERVTEIDVLTAFGMSDQIGDLNALGGLMLTLKGGVRSKSLFYMPGQDIFTQDMRKAAECLSRMCRFHKLFKRTKADRRLMLAQIVVVEKIYDQCVHCMGSGIAISEFGVKSQCEHCEGDGELPGHGNGKRVYENWERMAIIFEARIKRFVDSPARNKEGEKKYWERCQAFHDDMLREYLRHCDRQVEAMHALLSIAMKDKVNSVAHMLERR